MNPQAVNDVTVNTRNVCITHVNALHGKHCIQLMSATQCIANAFHVGCFCFTCYSNIPVRINDVYTFTQTGKFTGHTGGNYTVTFSGYAALDPEEKVVYQQMHNDQSVGYQGRWNVLKERHILSLPR